MPSSKPRRLSVPAISAIKRKGCETPEEVAQFSAQQILTWKGIGPGLLKEIREWLQSHGFDLCELMPSVWDFGDKKPTAPSGAQGGEVGDAE